MQTQYRHKLTAVLALLLTVSQSWATCGGGGGGGMGGTGGGTSAMPDAPVYHVPWKPLQPSDPPIKAGLILYWFPSSVQEFQRSSLLNSRMLTMYATQCVTMAVLDAGSQHGQKLAPGAQLPVAVLAEPDDTIVAKAENQKGFLRVEQVEKLVEAEMKKREGALKERLDSAKSKAKAGDNPGAIEELRAVVEQKCLFPNRAKDAAKELKKLGVTDVGQLFDAPVTERAASAKIEATMRAALRAENLAHYRDAEKLYRAARQLDPMDPVPLRYLGELYRHHTGEWDKARRTFDQLLAQPADPLSRAVALHGLGKMTIHEGQFDRGRALMEDSVREFPLALAYRNLAVYWNSEGDAQKTDYYVQKALALDPADPYNVVFAAVFLAEAGKTAEALKIAQANEALLPASYNLAAIYAQAGQKDKALALLQRHFFEYERYQAVRSKEMMEARVDAVFETLKKDAGFVALTSGADGMLDANRPMPGQQ